MDIYSWNMQPDINIYKSQILESNSCRRPSVKYLQGLKFIKRYSNSNTFQKLKLLLETKLYYNSLIFVHNKPSHHFLN